MNAQARTLVEQILARPHDGPRAGYLLLSTGAVSMDDGEDVPLSARDLLIDIVIEHLPEVYHRTRSIWPRRAS